MMTRSDRRGMGCLILFATPFAGAGLFVGYLALSMLVGWVEVQGFGKQRILQRDEIDSIKSARGMQSGNKLFHQIEVRTKDGKKHTIATQIGSLQLAKSLVKEIGTTLGD